MVLAAAATEASFLEMSPTVESPPRRDGPNRPPKAALAEESLQRVTTTGEHAIDAAAAVAPSELDPWRLTVTPPPRSDGVATMLVALGRAGVVVFHAEPASDSGAYALTLAPGL